MKKILTISLIVLLLPTALIAGLNFGLIKTAKKRVDKIDAKVVQTRTATAIVPDTQAPTVPNNLTAVAISSCQINLSWTASTDNVGVTTYKVYRNGGTSPIATPTVTNYNDTGLTASTVYSYTISACDAAGNCSAQSVSASTTTFAPPDTQAPTVPTNFTAVTVSSAQIDLSWTASTDNVGVTTYKIYRDGSATPTYTPTGITFSDIWVAGATAYSYTISACDAAGNCSALSTSVSTTTPGTAVGGIISANTIWSLGNSPYILTGDVQLAYGATLTIQPGVAVEGNNVSKIKVFGALNAIGNSSQKIILNHVLIGGFGTGAQNHSINIQFADINYGNPYAGDGFGFGGYGNVTLTDSKLQNTEWISLYGATSDCHIERNTFSNSQGISGGMTSGGTVYIQNNVFYMQTSYSNYGTFAVQSWGNSPLIVAYNSFLSTDRIALRLRAEDSNAAMTAINNYWNTTNTATIDAMIYDKNDDLSLGSYITYTPILTSPDPSTPTFP